MKLVDIKPNPKNPRLIKDDKFKKLVQSLTDLPVMAELREVIVDENSMIIGGNMRYRAAKTAGWIEIPTKVFTRDDADRNNRLTGQSKTYEQYIDEIIIKDNVSGGEWDWDILSNEWDSEDLNSWGVDTPSDFVESDSEPSNDESDLKTIVVVAYSNIEDLDKITELYSLEAMDITEDIKSDLTSLHKVYVFKK